MIPEEIELKLLALIRRVEVVECTAVCVELALLEQRSDREREIAICVERNIADELGRISKEAGAILVALNRDEFTPLLKSPLLGVRIRPLRDKATRRRR